jgi:hypothetical protein
MGYKTKQEVYAYMKRREQESDNDFAIRVAKRMFNLKIAYSEPDISFKKGDFDETTMCLEIIKVTETSEFYFQ